MAAAKKARRAKGEGSIYAHPKGYCAVIDLGKDPSGKRVRKTFYAPTKAKVKAKRDTWLQKNERSLPAAPGPVVRDIARVWIEHLRKERDVAPATVDLYEMWIDTRIVYP